MDLQDLLLVSIALFVFSALACNKSSATCVVFALTSFLVIGAMAVLETTSLINENLIRSCESANDNRERDRNEPYILAPTNPRYGNKETGTERQNNINGQVIEVEPIRCDAFESELSFLSLIPCLI